ncbi:MAG: matrixin family metalloprotease [Myxococcota bacterium]|nr:matrixin family metalloprotease [Myxococcota bacterium]
MKGPAYKLLFGLCAAVLLSSSAAWGFSVRMEGNYITRWPDAQLDYYIQYAGSDDLTPEESLVAVYTAFNSWESQNCTKLTFTELGDAPNPKSTLLTGSGPNEKNELVWIEDDDWTMGQNVLGVTAPLTDPFGNMFEADIAFNGYLLTWTITGNGGTDLEAVALHEIGHMFGMQHNLGPYPWNDPPTMAPSIAPKKKSRTLEDDDIMGLCFLYPANDVWLCNSDDVCPKIIEKDAEGDEYYAGAFVCDPETQGCDNPNWYPAGIAQLGEKCTTDASCVDGLYCQPWEESQVCTRYCQPAYPDCEEGFECAPFSPPYQNHGACLPEDGMIKEPGTDSCLSSLVCQGDDVCLPTPEDDKKICTSLCPVDEDDACPEGQACWSYGNPTGGCFPLGMFPGADDPAEEPEAEMDASVSNQKEIVLMEPDVEVGPTPDVTLGPEGVEPPPLVEEPTPGDQAGGCSGAAPPAALLWLLGLFGLLLPFRRRSARV